MPCKGLQCLTSEQASNNTMNTAICTYHPVYLPLYARRAASGDQWVSKLEQAGQLQ